MLILHKEGALSKKFADVFETDRSLPMSAGR